jgi:dipeptidyl aminopeptidase/acylaminoacyl peptidase
MSTDATPRGPTPERLLDVRTPAELAFSPDGSTLAFALHATVADEGSFQPSDLYLADVATGSTERLTSGSWSDRTPAWSPDGSRIAFLSDRVMPGHQQPYTMIPGSDPVRVTILRGSAESVAWSTDGERLLVLAADPGCYGLDWSARAVNGAGPVPDPMVTRPGEARRRLFLVELASGEAAEVGPDGMDVWEADWDGDETIVAIASEAPGGSGWYQSRLVRLDLRTLAVLTLYEPTWQIQHLALNSDARRAALVEGYASDHGLLSGSVMVVDVAGAIVTDPWPDLQTVGTVEWVDDASLWYARCDGTGTGCGRIWLDGGVEERWRGDAFIGDEVTTPSCVTREEAAVVWTTHQAHGQPPELARFDPETAMWSRLTGFNDAVIAEIRFPDARTIHWNAEDGTEIEGVLMTPQAAEGPLPMIVCVHGGPTWNWGSSPIPNPMPSCSLRPATRAYFPTLAGASGVGMGSRKRSSATAAGSTLTTSWRASIIASPRGSPIRTDSASAGSPTAGTWRGGRSGRPIASARRLRCRWSRTTSRST